jgi:DNA polymerase-1
MDLSQKAQTALRLVREAPLIAFDTETSGVDWKVNQPIGYVITDPNVSVYVPIRHGGGGNLPGAKPMQTPTDDITPSDFEVELNKAFADRERLKIGRAVGHNMKFDVHMAANAGVMLGRNIGCTQLMHAMLDEYTKEFSLDGCAGIYGVTAKLGEELYQAIADRVGVPANKKVMEHFWEMPGNDRTVMDYAEGDGVTTIQLWQELVSRISDEKMDFIAQIENDLIWTVFRMERRGIKVDLGELVNLREATEQQIRLEMEDLPVGFNPRSPIQMKNYMIEQGHTNWPMTEIGNPSFTEKWLKTHDAGRKIIRIRQFSNLINSFVNPLEQRHVYQGRVHATLNQLKTETGGTIARFSCQRPSLQQVPKRVKELAKPFRRLFVSDEGYVFFDSDWSQAEPRLFAHYSGAKALLEGYNSTPFRDAHTVTAELLGVERDPTAKRMNMGILTGMQSASLAGHMGCSESQAREWMYDFFGIYPEIKEFQDKAKSRLKNRGYVKTILGRRCRLEHPRFAYRGTSKVIQGSQADLMKERMLTIDRFCEANDDKVHLLMTIHDAIQGQFQEGCEALYDEVLRIFVDVQSEPYNLRVPFVAEGGVGTNWSVATFGEDT